MCMCVCVCKRVCPGTQVQPLCKECWDLGAMVPPGLSSSCLTFSILLELSPSPMTDKLLRILKDPELRAASSTSPLSCHKEGWDSG